MKNKFFYYPLLALVFILAVVLVWLLVTIKNKPSQVAPVNYPTAREAVNWDAPLLQKIEVEFMSKEEKASMNIADNPQIRLQVLERDEKGKATAYKKIYKDADIIEYVRDPNLMPVATSTEPITEN